MYLECPRLEAGLVAGDIPLGEEYGDELAACTCPEVENGALFLSDGDLS